MAGHKYETEISARTGKDKGRKRYEDDKDNVMEINEDMKDNIRMGNLCDTTLKVRVPNIHSKQPSETNNIGILDNG